MRSTSDRQRPTTTSISRSRQQALTCAFVVDQPAPTTSRPTRRVVGSRPVGGARLLSARRRPPPGFGNAMKPTVSASAAVGALPPRRARSTEVAGVPGPRSATAGPGPSPHRRRGPASRVCGAPGRPGPIGCGGRGSHSAASAGATLPPMITAAAASVVSDRRSARLPTCGSRGRGRGRGRGRRRARARGCRRTACTGRRSAHRRRSLRRRTRRSPGRGRRRT